MLDTHVTLAHGNGGLYMRELIEEVFARHLGNPDLDLQCDAAVVPSLEQGELLITTDAFTVQPLEFPGGDIGSLAVHGTVNDLAVAGATRHYLTLNALIEEGLEMVVLERIVASIGQASRACGVRVVAGDTKVVPRGQGGGLYLATTGIGIRPVGLKLGADRIRPGDRIMVSGPIGDHGVAVMLAREEFGMHGSLESDADSVIPLTTALTALEGLRFMRDPTRGGLVTVCHEICRAAGLAIRLQQYRIPVRDPVASVCEILGYDPLYLACEGRVVAVVAADIADTALQKWQALPQGREAALVGEVRTGRGRVEAYTELGGARILEELEDDPLPRIC